MKAVAVGDQAPRFSRSDQDGQKICLDDLLGNKTIVLFFYPADESPICTKEACAFRDAYEAFIDAGAMVIGVSSDTVESHRQFAIHHRLPFRLLSDKDSSLRRAFGTPKTLGLLPGRVTYVIDPQGTVRHVFTAQVAARRHVQEALTVVRKISAEGKGL